MSNSVDPDETAVAVKELKKKNKKKTSKFFIFPPIVLADNCAENSWIFCQQVPLFYSKFSQYCQETVIIKISNEKKNKLFS